jgi:hypothetical protein
MDRTCSIYIGERKGICRILVGKPEKRGHLEDTGIDGRML